MFAALIVAVACLSAARAEELPGIYTMDAAGGNFRLLVKLPDKWNGTPTFSPDGKQVIFDACNGYEFDSSHVYIVPADGTGEPKDMGLGNTPAWSPDGKRIAYFVHNGNPDQIEPGSWVMNADGSERMWLHYGGSPRWSPDGKRLLVINNPDGAGDGLYLVDLENNESTPVLDRTYARINGGAWSPDGKRLAFIGNGAAGPELAIVSLVGDDRAVRVRLTGDIGWRPAWNPDGKHIACWIRKDGRELLHNVEVDSTRVPELMAHQDLGRVNSDPAWSADGKRFVFNSNR